MKFSSITKLWRPTVLAATSLVAFLLMACDHFWDPLTSTGTTATTTTLTAANSSVSAGASDTLTATVSPSAATGTVTFYEGGTSIGTGTLSSGTATYAATFSAAGTESITATYGGDSTYSTSTSSAISITVAASAASPANAVRAGGEDRGVNLVLAPDATWTAPATVHLHNLARVVVSGSSASNIEGGHCVLYSGTLYLAGGAESRSGVYDLPGGGYLAPEDRGPDLGCE